MKRRLLQTIRNSTLADRTSESWGLPVKDGDCKETVVDFLRNKLKIRDITSDDIEAAHILPKRPASGETADDNQTARTEPSQR